jgi:hypothetical protein
MERRNDLFGGITMTSPAFTGSHCRIEGLGFTVHWMEPDRIVLKTGDSRIRKPDGSRPGIWFSASSNPDSADYHPNNFNRLAGILQEHGLHRTRFRSTQGAWTRGGRCCRRRCRRGS